MNAEKRFITKMEQQKGNKKRYNIYVNDEYAFGIHEKILVHLHEYQRHTHH